MMKRLIALLLCLALPLCALAEGAAYEKITVAKKQMFLTSGETVALNVNAEPADADDSLVYATSNPAVVAVADGALTGKAPGSAKITVSSEKGSAKVDIIVVVKAAKPEKPITAIDAAEEIALNAGQTHQLEVAVTPNDHTDALFYTVADPRVATVDDAGLITAVAEGKTTVTIVTASGMKHNVQVKVAPEGAAPAGSVNVAAAIYYNDQVNDYYASEPGETVTITGNGAYTVTFDCEKHLTQAARDAGVTNLCGAGAIYIFDVTMKSGVVASCDIHYDEILLDDVPLIIREHEPKSALKATGILDTNDPLNCWDGSVAEGVIDDKETFNLIYPEGMQPTRITITFTISNWQMAE